MGDLSETKQSTCMIEDPSETNMPHHRQTCLIGDPSESNMPDRRPNGYIKMFNRGMSVSHQGSWSPIGNVGL